MSNNQSMVFASPSSDMFCGFVRYYVEYDSAKGQVFWSIVESGSAIAKQGLLLSGQQGLQTLHHRYLNNHGLHSRTILWNHVQGYHEHVDLRAWLFGQRISGERQCHAEWYSSQCIRAVNAETMVSPASELLWPRHFTEICTSMIYTFWSKGLIIHIVDQWGTPLTPGLPSAPAVGQQKQWSRWCQYLTCQSTYGWSLLQRHV